MPEETPSVELPGGEGSDTVEDVGNDRHHVQKLMRELDPFKALGPEMI